jgi:membrane fusion protein, copper/silver efflux system
LGKYYPVMKGLTAGNKIAAAGGFLIDAETRLNPAAASTYFGASGGPQVGGSPNAPIAPSQPQLGPVASAATPNAEDLENINQLPESDRKLAIVQRACPITGAALGSMGVPVKIVLRGQPVFLCCQGCVAKANQNPDETLKRVDELKHDRKNH